MPIRRQTASPGFSTPPPSTRGREMADTWTVSEMGLKDMNVGEGRIVSAMVGRLVNKLPCNSGIRLGMMEADPAIKQTVGSLLGIARLRPNIVIQALASALETLAKYSGGSTTDTPLETLHSQLYLLHLLFLALSTSWRAHAEAHPPPVGDLPRCFPDPTPLDDSLARYLLAVTLIYARVVSIEAGTLPGTSSPAPSREGKGAGTSSSMSLGLGISPGSGSNPLGARFIQRHSFPSGSTSTLPSLPPKSFSGECDTNQATIYEMTKLVSRIIFYLSASNWSLLAARIKARISYLQTTIEDSPDTVELRLLEWSNLNRNRMGQILQDLSSTFLHVKRPAQISIATVLRKAIWTWIEVHPSEYEVLVESSQKMEGGPDVLFDILHSASDITASSHARRTRAFYPLMAMLLILSPDLFKRAAMGDTGNRAMGGLSKKLSYVESLRKGVASTKGFEACAICYIDFVRAAMYISPRFESSGVRNLALDIQNDLKNALFYATMSSEITDPDTLVDGLVSLYRANPVSVTGLLFGKLFADSNEVNRTVAVKACQVIQVEDGRLPWYPPASDLRDRVAAAVRSVLKTQVASTIGDWGVTRRPRASLDLPTNQHDIIREILHLYILDPQYAIAGTSQGTSDGLNDILRVTSGLMLSPSPESVRSIAARCNVALLAAIAGEDEQVVAGSGDAVWQLLLDTARQVLHAVQSDPDALIGSFTAFREVAIALAFVSTTHIDMLSSSMRGEPAALISLVAMLTALVSPDYEQLGHSVPALRALKELTWTAHKKHLPAETPGSNFGGARKRLEMRCKVFDLIANLPVATGRQQQQRQFRKVYRPFTIPTTGGVSVWLGVSTVAKSLTSKIIEADASKTTQTRRRGLAPEIDGLDEGQSKAWQNITLFLASTAGVCRYETSPPPSLVDQVGKGLLPKAYEEFPDPMVACESFIRECVDLLLSGSLHVRETVKEALGTELPGPLMRIMIDQMTKLLRHSIGSNGITPSETFTAFVDQVLTVLRLAIERMDIAEQGGIQVDTAQLLSLLVQYAHRLGRDDSSLRLKIKLCQLVASALSKNGCIILTDEASLRNAILECLIDWAVDAQRDNDSYRHMAESSTKTHREFEHVILKAIVPVTDGLTLRPPGDESNQASAAVKTRIFYRYYAYLVKVLDRSRSAEEESLHGTTLIGSRAATYEDHPSLALSALSNLLAANLDVGLKYCLSLGYHEDSSLRTAFMRLLTSILQRGARFGGLSAKRLSSAPKPYLDLLTSDPDNLAMAVAMCDCASPSEIDELSLLLFRVFESKGNCLGLVKTLAEREIAQTNHESELFRANSITTRVLTIFARTYGYNYVRATLQPLVHSLVEKPAECSFELDPSKAGPNDDIERNADHLQLMCQALLDLICSSTARAPVMFRAFCHHLWEITADRFPESRHSVIGSFIFLRFFCPAIVAPENIDLDVSPDTREVRRALLLITKVIQNLANNVTFGNKEPHMKVLNGFLAENIRQVSKFLSEMASKPKAGEVAEVTAKYMMDHERHGDSEGDEAILHRFIARNYSKVESSLASLPSTFRYGPGGAKVDRMDLNGNKAMEDLRRVWDRGGTPSDGSGMSASARGVAYEDFMRHNAGRDIESVATAFYEGPISQNSRRIFYFIVSRVGLLDYDLLAYHIFSTLDKIADFFDVVVDLTDFSAATELPLGWLKRTIQMCPPGILPCVNTLALYNPNAHARRRVRQIVADLLTITSPIGKQVVAASSPAELAEFIPFTSLALPEYTMALAYEAEHVFTNLLCLSDHEQQVPVVVKLGHDCMQIASWRKQELTPTVKSYIIDVVRLKDVDDILTGGSLPTDHLLIKHRQNETVTFISRKRDEMAQIIRAARSRLRDGPSEDRSLGPSDVPGTLLNVALLNMSSGDETLRLGAYNLVYELSGFFKWELALSVLQVTTGLSIPNNSLAFAYSLSFALAQSAPHLTVEFLKEWTIGFSRGDISQKCAALHYISPWLDNLESYSRPSKEREDVESGIKIVQEIVRGLVSITIAERRRLHLAVQEHIWARIANAHEGLVEVVTAELIHTAVDAGFGSDKSECAADILVSIGGTSIRGRIIARLRKLIARTYLKPSPTLPDNAAWPEISTLARIMLALSFNPTSSLDAQLFLPELFHVITLLLGTGSLLMRQTIYGLTVNVVQSLASSAAHGDMDASTLQCLLKRLQSKEMVAHFGLILNGASFDIVKTDDETLLTDVEEVAKFLSEVLESGAVSMDCANAWRARWMGLVAGTCFQHNPAIQPQAFTVLGYLAADEVDDDMIYQILVAMGTTLIHFTEGDNILLIAMLRCLCRITPGLLPESRYAASLFWLAVGVLQLGYIPPFAAALELLLVALRSMTLTEPMMDSLLEARAVAVDAANRLDQVAGVSFESDPGFSFVGVIYKGVRHPSTRKLAVEVMRELLKTCQNTTPAGAKGRMVCEDGVGFFMALLPLVAGNEAELRGLMKVVGVEWEGEVSRMKVLDLLTLPDNSTALLLITLVTTLLQTASSETEKIVLYRFLAEASVEMPEVVAMAYDSLIPRMTAVLSTTSTLPVLQAVSTLLETALRDPTYSFPANLASDSSHSLHQSQSGPHGSGMPSMGSHAKSYSASISSMPSMGMTGRDQVLDDLGMRGLGELSFAHMKADKVVGEARLVAALIDSFTV